MVNVVLARVDDRLIHGQVMTAWVQFTGANHIIIVDDETAKDEFTRTILTMAVPKNIKLHIFCIEEAIAFKNTVEEDLNVILLAKYPGAFYQLIERGWNLNTIVIGGMGSNKDRVKLYKNVAASNSEREIMKKMIDHGVNIRIQIIPDQKSISVHELL